MGKGETTADIYYGGSREGAGGGVLTHAFGRALVSVPVLGLDLGSSSRVEMPLLMREPSELFS